MALLVKMETWVNMLHLLTQLQKKLQPDLKTNTTQSRQKIELHGSPATKDLKKPHSSRWVGGVEGWKGGDAEAQRHREMQGDAERCREVQRGAERCREVQ